MNEEPWPRPMSALGACALVLVAFALMLAWLQAVEALSALGRLGTAMRARPAAGPDPLNVGFATALGVSGALWLGRAWHEPNAPWARLLALRPVPWSALGLSIICGLSLQVPLTELQNLAESIFPIDPEQKQAIYRMLTPSGWAHTLGTAFALVAIAPVFEELLFRGLILIGLRKRYGVFRAVALSSVLFGLCHVRIVAALFPACGAGVILGAIALRTRSIWPAIVSHAAINAAPLLVSEQLLAVPGFNVASQRVEHVPLPLLLAGSAVAAAAITALLRPGACTVPESNTRSNN